MSDVDLRQVFSLGHLFGEPLRENVERLHGLVVSGKARLTVVRLPEMPRERWLSTGAFRIVPPPADGFDLSLHSGYDDYAEDDFTPEEKREIADKMIEAWNLWASQP